MKRLSFRRMNLKSCFDKEYRNDMRKFMNESSKHRVKMMNGEIFCYREADYQVKKRYRKMNHIID